MDEKRKQLIQTSSSDSVNEKSAEKKRIEFRHIR